MTIPELAILNSSAYLTPAGEAAMWASCAVAALALWRVLRQDRRTALPAIQPAVRPSPHRLR